MQALVTGICADRVCESRCFVDREVVCIAEISVNGIGQEILRCGKAAQTREVENLHTMRACTVSHDKGVVQVDLDVPPRRNHSIGWELSQVDRIFGVSHINKRSTSRLSHQRVFVARHRVSPTPDVVAVTASHRIVCDSLA